MLDLSSPRRGGENRWAGGEKALASSFAGPHSPLLRDGKLEMVLGTRKAGTTSLLLTAEEVSIYYRERRNGDPKAPTTAPIQASAFEALSPIVFNNPQELEEKLKKYKHKKGNYDSSSANAPYRKQTPQGLMRVDFELNRTLYHLLQRKITPEKYGLPRGYAIPASTRFCVVSYSFWSWQYDKRSVSERRSFPKILDVSFAEIDPAFLTLKQESVKHFIVEENRGLGSSKTMKPDRQVEPETLKAHLIGARLSEFLSPREGRTVVLAYDSEVTINVMRTLGVQHPTSSDLKPLLPMDQSSVQHSPSRYSSNDYESRRNRPRSRSRSPVRSNGGSDPRTRRRESPPPRCDPDVPSAALTAPLILIDVMNQFFTMTQTMSHPTSTPFEIGGPLNVYKRVGNEWSALFQARIILESWKAMASGPSIDDQRVQRSEGWGVGAPQSRAILDPPPVVPANMDDEDCDVNDQIPDIPVPKPPTGPCPTAVEGYDPEDISDYDDE